jgi:hypothetical protein
LLDRQALRRIVGRDRGNDLGAARMAEVWQRLERFKFADVDGWLCRGSEY